jgi:hypothetical protein
MKFYPLSSLHFALLFGLVLLAGCNNTYDFKVDAMHNPELAEAEVPDEDGELKSYALVSTDPVLQPGDLRFEEFAQYVETALAGRGYYRTNDPATADLIITFEASLSDPTTEYRPYSVPVYEYVPGQIVSEQVPVYNSKGQIVGYQVVQRRLPPEKQIAGFETHYRPITVYEKRLIISARANSASEDTEIAPEVWNLVVSNRDESADLRSYVPYMAAAAMPHLGGATDGEVEVKVKETDDSVAFIKKGI